MKFSPAFDALSRETAIAAEMIASGVALLGKATGPTHGYLGQALFNLSIGFERLGKLVFVIKHHNDNTGAFPTDRELKDLFGHGIRKLFDYAAGLAPGYLADSRVPSDPIHYGILDTLTEFGKTTRYYNLNVLSAANTSQVDPVQAWYEKVGVPILERHYQVSKRKKDENLAQELGAVMDQHSMTILTGIDQQPVGSAIDMLRDAAASRVTQRWSKMYTLQIARFWSNLLYALESEAHEMASRDIPFLHEFTVLFRNPEDAYFRNRKSWSIYRL